MNNCHENAQCTNTEGSFNCSCNPGYSGDGVNCTSKLVVINRLLVHTFCRHFISLNLSVRTTYIPHATCFLPILIDINECELRTHTCDSNANCTDTDGSFNCTCREGFEGDGLVCTGIIIMKVNPICMVTMLVLLQIFQSVKDN